MRVAPPLHDRPLAQEPYENQSFSRMCRQRDLCECDAAPISPAMAGDDRNNRPIEVTFTKWIPTGTLLTGVTGGAAGGVFVGEVLETQHSANPEVNPNPDADPALNKNGIQRLEAILRG